MLYLLTIAIAGLPALYLARDLHLGDRYPEWRERRLREGRSASRLAFLYAYGWGTRDGASFLEINHPRNRGLQFRMSLTFLLLFAFFFSCLWLLLAIVAAQF